YGLTYSQGVTPPPSCYVAKREKRVKGEGEGVLFYLEIGLCMCRLGVLIVQLC
ncbi:hypothetical protein NEQG_02695, partial [Nematocida parisii ERTm3]